MEPLFTQPLKPANSWNRSFIKEYLISHHADHPWPAKSPDLSPLDYLFWTVAMREMTKVPPSSIKELKSTVERFAEILDPEEVFKAMENVRKRAQVCVSRNGGQFQHRLHKHKIAMRGVGKNVNVIIHVNQ